MNRYEPWRFHPLFGIAAIAMTTLTLAGTVFVPANLSPIGNETATLAARATTATEAKIYPYQIQVIGIRERGQG